MECLYFSSAIVTLWKNSEDPIVRKLCATALAAAENALQLQVVSEASVQVNGEGYVVQHENYGDACGPFCGNMLNLAFGYYYTQDAAYFEKAKELMLAYAQYEKWHGKGFKGRGELNTGHFCVGMAYGYACFGSLLTDAEREIIVQGTYKLGILPLLEDWLLPGTKIHAFDTMGHNWWPVCVSDGAFAAIIMCDALAAICSTLHSDIIIRRMRLILKKQKNSCWLTHSMKNGTAKVLKAEGNSIRDISAWVWHTVMPVSAVC